MSLFRFALKNIEGNLFRSLVVIACALVVSGFTLSTTLIIRGAESSLAQANQRLGADILLVPKGAGAASKTALIMGRPAYAWMPGANLDKISRVPGVAHVSPQLYLGTMLNSPYCVASEMFVVAIDPQTDFSIGAWLPQPLTRPLAPGYALGGTFVTADNSGIIDAFGVPVTLVANLEPTGTGLDQTLFVSFETAQEVLGRPRAPGNTLIATRDSVSALLVRVQNGSAVPVVAMQIQQVAPDLTAIDSPDLIQSQRRQMAGLANTVLAAVLIGLALSVAAIYLIFAMAVNERRWQIGVLRALGATRRQVFFSLLLEANVLGLAGGAMGLALASAILYLRRGDLISTLQIPFLLPSTEVLAVYLLAAMAAISASITLSALVPALSISRQEPSLAMRE